MGELERLFESIIITLFRLSLCFFFASQFGCFVGITTANGSEKAYRDGGSGLARSICYERVDTGKTG